MGSRTISVIVPMMNAMRFLPITLPGYLSACKQHGAAELIIVDNGSTDGSVDYVREHAGRAAILLLCPDVTVAAMRNAGARNASGEFLSFIDVDCEISPGYFDSALRAFDATDAAATGSRCALPDRPHWTEAVWDRLHRRPGDGFVGALNGGNLIVRASCFWAVNGFRESLVSGEDPDLCERLIEAGFSIYEDHRVRAVHHGNPKTLSAFFHKEIWRGLGMISHGVNNKPALMTFAHIYATIAGIGLVSHPSISVGPALLVAGVLQLSVPSASVAYRWWSNGLTRNPGGAVILYWAYYHARSAGMILNLLSRVSGRVPELGRLAWKTASKG
jgi:glycosyltransferase involved in cell wall biosynthesis